MRSIFSPPSPRNNAASIALRACLVGLAYYLTARVGLLLAFAHTNVTSVWPASGIALGSLLLLGNSYWPVLTLSSFLLNVTTGLSPIVSAAFAAGNTLEYVTAAILLRRLNFDGEFRRLRNVVLLALPGALISPMIAATVGTFALRLAGIVSPAEAPFIWQTYEIGDAVGILVFTPLLLAWCRPFEITRVSARMVPEAALQGFLTLVIAGSIFIGGFGYAYFIFPLTIWTAARFGQKGTSLTMLVATCVAVWGTAHGSGPFSRGSGIDNLVRLQIFLATFAITTLSLTTTALAWRNSEQEVLERTAELERANAELEKLYRHEHRIASRFQESSLPKLLPHVPGIRFHCYYGPGKSEALVGGDWYDAFRLPNGRVLISIGDVSGSGLNAAVTMSGIRQVIRGTGQVHPDPTAMLNAADKVLRAEHPSTMVTAFVGLLDPIERTLTYTSAGHPPPLIRQADGTLDELSSHGLMLGLRGPDEPAAVSLHIDDGSCLLLYTDGLIESRHDYEEGERRLHTEFTNIQLPTSIPSVDIAKKLYDCLLQDGSSDDVAILAVEFLPFDATDQHGAKRWTFDTADIEAVRTAQHAFTACLVQEGMPDADVVTAELVLAELLGNAARYAPGPVEVCLDFSTPSLLLHVIDHGPGFQRRSRLPSDLLSESGRGLFLISALTEEFHVSKIPGEGSHACAVLKMNDNRLRERNRTEGEKQ
jgi:serine phosphatase RsbU (regulator of sigma subunit)/integral membrane sensor domain MASE1/anti-sigma regulatory factor (Ser/Thr protein kinase)